MAEIECFIEFQDAEPLMMTIDKQVDFKTFNEEIQSRLSKNNVTYTYNTLNSGDKVIQNDADLLIALNYVEKFGIDLFVIRVTEKEAEVEEQKILAVLEELEKQIPEENNNTNNTSTSLPQAIPNNVIADDDNVENKKDEKKAENFIDFMKNQLSEQLPFLSPILDSINLDQIVNNIAANNIKEKNNENSNGSADLLSNIMNNLQNFMQIPPQNAPQVHPSPSQSANFLPFLNAFIPPVINSQSSSPSSPPSNPLQFASFFDLINGSLDNLQAQNEYTNEVPENHNQKTSSDVIHFATCDKCNKRIIGIRYKCLSCPDFDLCSTCEVNSPQIHDSTHVFAKLRNTTQYVRTSPPPPSPSPIPPYHLHRTPAVNPQPRVIPPFYRAHPPHPLHSSPSVHPKPHCHFRQVPIVNNANANHFRHPQCHRPKSYNVPQSHPFVNPFAHPQCRPQPSPVVENNKVKSLEEQISALESSIKDIKSSLRSVKEEQKPQYPSHQHNYYYGSDDDDEDDLVYEIKVNKW